MCKEDNRIEYIKIEWSDIHHTRKQEWKISALIGGLVVALFSDKVNHDLQIAFSILGITFSLLGVYITSTHWNIFKKKIRLIKILEDDYSKDFEFHRSLVSVQGIIMFVHFILAASFAGFLLYITTENIELVYFVSIIIIIVGAIVCLVQNFIHRIDEKKPLKDS